ncbi:hypothetical protein C8R44DRAFT_824996 [Mycena epipterygia]|nr:hypothetical protein C8R44DRAFT_824996 [Mycena epipterygia]
MRAKFAQIAGIAALASPPPSCAPTSHNTSLCASVRLHSCCRPALVSHARTRDRADRQGRRRPARELLRARRRPQRALRLPPAPPHPAFTPCPYEVPLLDVAARAVPCAPLPADIRHPGRPHVYPPPRLRLTTLLLLPPAFLAYLERPSTSHANSHSRSQDAAHTAILAALTSGTTRHTFAADLHAAFGGSLTALMGHAGHVKEL